MWKVSNCLVKNLHFDVQIALGNFCLPIQRGKFILECHRALTNPVHCTVTRRDVLFISTIEPMLKCLLKIDLFPLISHFDYKIYNQPDKGEGQSKKMYKCTFVVGDAKCLPINW